MNKYSKRALKTTATVGMSLAMVLSAAAMPLSVKAANICDTVALTCGKDVYFSILDVLKDVDFADITMYSSDVIKVDGAEYNVILAIKEYNESLTLLKNDSMDTTVNTNIKTWLTAIEKMDEMFSGWEAVTDETAESAINGLTGEVLTVETKTTIGDTGSWVDADGVIKSASVKPAKESLKKMNEFEAKDYARLTTNLQERFSLVKSNLEEVLDGYLTSNDEDLAAYYEAFDKVLQNDIDGKDTTLSIAENELTGLGIATGTSPETYKVTKVNLSSKSSITGRINAIKKSDSFDRFENEDLVISLIEAYEELLSGLGDLSTITSNDSYKAYTKTKTDAEDETVKNFLFGLDGLSTKKLDLISTKEALADAKLVAKNLDREQFEVLKGLKEDSLDLAYNFETKKVGNYYTDKSDWNPGVTSAQKTTLGSNVPAFLFKVVDTETGEFGYDYVATRMEAFIDAFDAATKNLEKLTPANIKASDKAALVAAEDAIYDLTDGGKYVANLTTKEKKTVKVAETKITNLREAFDNLGTTTAAGWYDMGNGNWGYNNEDGTPAAYKWVASGSNWYFVRDGKMARNTWLAANSTDWYYLGNDGKMATSVSVDGCWINSLGIYRK